MLPKRMKISTSDGHLANDMGSIWQAESLAGYACAVGLGESRWKMLLFACSP
jgi:hypothetical protein